MKKRKFILLGVVVVLIALLLEAGILNNVNNRNTYATLMPHRHGRFFHGQAPQYPDFSSAA